jgi:hypothetical protein
MKKILFTLVMIAALAMVANEAFAQPVQIVTQGGTYTYTLNGIVVNTDGSVSIDFDGDASEIVTISSGFSSTAPTAPAGSYNGVFTIEFSETAVDGDLNVIVTDGATNGCSNRISLAIEVLPAPTIALDVEVAPTSDFCQVLHTDPLEDNTAASVADLTETLQNTIVFTVDATITNPPAAYTYQYEISLTNAADQSSSLLDDYLITYSGPGTYNNTTGIVSGASTDADGVFTITFTTTTGLAPQAILANINVSTIDLTETSGSGVYDGTSTTNTASINVRSMPSIGSFQ